MDTDLIEKAQAIVRLIQSGRFDLSSEKRLQSDIETLFLAKGVDFQREARLGDGDIPDFSLRGVLRLSAR